MSMDSSEAASAGGRQRPARMRAAVFSGPGTIESREVERPDPGPDRVRVRVEGCGVCGSNLPSWQGRPWFQYPLPPGSPGHEGWGVIDAVGRNVRSVREGDRVAFFSNGAFAEYDLADEQALVPLPESMNGRAFPGEPFGCAFNVFRRSRIAPVDTVAVVGIGFIGAVVAALAKGAGATVIAIGRRPFALELARRYGVDVTIPMDDHHRIIERVRDLTHGRLCDRVVEAVGEQWPLDLATELTRERGTLVLAGYHQDGPRQVNLQLWNWRGLDVVNAHERDVAVYREGTRLAVEAVVSGALDPQPLLTHSVPLDRMDQAFRLMTERPDGFLKAVVIP